MSLRSVSAAFAASAVLAVLGSSLTLAPVSAAQAAPSADAGKDIFATKCAICHNADSTDQKIGPGLKGFYARGTFKDGSKITDEAVHAQIENGKTPMPPFKDVLKPEEIDSVVAYLKTL